MYIIDARGRRREKEGLAQRGKERGCMRGRGGRYKRGR